MIMDDQTKGEGPIYSDLRIKIEGSIILDKKENWEPWNGLETLGKITWVKVAFNLKPIDLLHCDDLQDPGDGEKMV